MTILEKEEDGFGLPLDELKMDIRDEWFLLEPVIFSTKEIGYSSCGLRNRKYEEVCWTLASFLLAFVACLSQIFFISYSHWTGHLRHCQRLCPASESSALWTSAMAEKIAETAMSLFNDIAQESFTAVIRSVSIHLSNRSEKNILTNPQVYTYSGYCYDPPQPTVGSTVTAVCAFGHTRGTPCGAVGVLTYDITADWKAVKRLAIMFSVPFDYNLYENCFALGLFDTNKLCDEALYKLMYSDKGDFKREKASGSEISFQNKEGSKFTLRGTMCPMATAEIKVELWDGGSNSGPRTARKTFGKLGKCFFKCCN